MGMTRGGKLVPDVATITKLTGVPLLGNLEIQGDLTLDDVLVTANDWVHDKLEGKGDPTKLTNEDRYERAVAWYFLSVLARTDSVDEPETEMSFLEIAKEEFNEIRSQFSDSDDARKGNEGIPRVGNMSTSPLFGSLP